MAKSDTFFIRAKVNQAGSSYTSEEIDLGSYVNLGVKQSTLLAIKSIQVQITDENLRYQGPYTTGAVLNVGWDLTTQAQTDLVDLDDKSVVASGRYEIATDASSVPTWSQDVRDLMPQDFAESYLVGVDTLYLNTNADSASSAGAYNISICMECELVQATQSNAVALALSQQ